jgi:hypothetical protein
MYADAGLAAADIARVATEARAGRGSIAPAGAALRLV